MRFSRRDIFLFQVKVERSFLFQKTSVSILNIVKMGLTAKCTYSSNSYK